MIAYMLLTYGPKPRGSVANHPAVRQQLANLDYYFKNRDAAKVDYYCDYTRRVNGLQSLPNLSELLKALHANQYGAVLMDDIGRLFRACPIELQVGLLEQISPYAHHLAGLRQRRRLSDMSDTDVANMVKCFANSRFTLAKPPQRTRGRWELRDQTEAATIASGKARGRAANEKAKALSKIKDFLGERNEKVTNGMIALEANRLGVRTTRDGQWSADTVGRVLKRLEISSRSEYSS